MMALEEGPVTEPISTSCSVSLGFKVDTPGRVTDDGAHRGWKMQNYSKQNAEEAARPARSGRGSAAPGQAGQAVAQAAAPPLRARSQARLSLLLQEQEVSCPASGIPVSGISPLAARYMRLCHGTDRLQVEPARAQSEGTSAGAGDAGRGTSEACRSLLLLPETHHPQVKPAGKPLEDAWPLGTGAVLAPRPPPGWAGWRGLHEAPPTPPKRAPALPFLLRNEARTGPVGCPVDVAWVSATFCRPEKKYQRTTGGPLPLGVFRTICVCQRRAPSEMLFGQQCLPPAGPPALVL